MRIYFSTISLPKKAAKRIQKHFTPEIPGLCQPMPLHEAQHLAAVMLGYQDWHDLEQETKSARHSPSLVDEKASPEEQAARIAFQADVLGQILPFTEPLLHEVALKLRVSAGAPFSTEFEVDAYRQNALFYWEPYGEDPEWRFRPSARSNEKRDELYYLLEQWGSGQITLGDLKEAVDRIIEEQPENIVPYLYIISAAGEVNYWEVAEPYLPKLESVIENSIPSDYPMKRKVPPLIWGTIDNRDYLRSLYFLAEGYYAAGNFKKAKQWFLFLTRCSEREIGNEKFYLHDLRQPKPKGDLHLID